MEKEIAHIRHDYNETPPKPDYFFLSSQEVHSPRNVTKFKKAELRGLVPIHKGSEAFRLSHETIMLL